MTDRIKQLVKWFPFFKLEKVKSGNFKIGLKEKPPLEESKLRKLEKKYKDAKEFDYWRKNPTANDNRTNKRR